MKKIVKVVSMLCFLLIVGVRISSATPVTLWDNSGGTQYLERVGTDEISIHFDSLRDSLSSPYLVYELGDLSFNPAGYSLMGLPSGNWLEIYDGTDLTLQATLKSASLAPDPDAPTNQPAFIFTGDLAVLGDPLKGTIILNLVPVNNDVITSGYLDEVGERWIITAYGSVEFYPVPEPSTLLLLIFGFLGIGACKFSKFNINKRN